MEVEPLGLESSQWHFLGNTSKYVDASTRAGRRLVLESTRRQFATARDILERLNGSPTEEARRGVLLADDVGLGKTTVAAMVAWIVASAGERRGVRILAPNDVMARRWSEELLSHVVPLKECAPLLAVDRRRVKVGKVGRLSAGSIQVVKHSYASSQNLLRCDLLIIDEAHRAKGENTGFSKALKRQKQLASRVLILTATPFSIRVDELERMLTLIGGESARGPVRTFSRALADLYDGNSARNPAVVAKRLADKAQAAVEALSACVVRHGIDDLPLEKEAFGERRDWPLPVQAASPDEIELMLRMDRALRVAKDGDGPRSNATNDPRFHVGWRHLDAVREDLMGEVPRIAEPRRAVVEDHLKAIRGLRDGVGIHSKMRAVGAVVKATIEQDEKVILFCHHHATAQELTAHLASLLPAEVAPRAPAPSVWREAWNAALRPTGNDHRHEDRLRATFVEWLCSDLIRAQTARWLHGSPKSAKDLTSLLSRSSPRRGPRETTIAQAAQELYDAMLQSRSTRQVLKSAEDRLELLPGANSASHVLGVCSPSANESEESLFLHNQQPDTVISIFNSPFGPDALVVTDKLSEGIDLHRYCRHLIHYELDPSPIRTVQRNGRLRRVNSWAAVTGQPIQYAFPAFRGTRDHRLVQIMKNRMDSFSLLLGGVHAFDVDEIVGAEERWRDEVIALAKGRLEKIAGRLRAR